MSDISERTVTISWKLPKSMGGLDLTGDTLKQHLLTVMVHSNPRHSVLKHGTNIPFLQLSFVYSNF
jgi:hypothetical protein